jgi:hypothetical protein
MYAGTIGTVIKETYEQALVRIEPAIWAPFNSWYKKDFLVLLDEKETSSKVERRVTMSNMIGKRVSVNSPTSAYSNLIGTVKSESWEKYLVEIDSPYSWGDGWTSWYKKEYVTEITEVQPESNEDPVEESVDKEERKVYMLYHCYSNYDGVVSIEDLVENYDGHTIYGTREEFNKEVMEEYDPSATYRVLVDNRMFDVRLSLILYEV